MSAGTGFPASAQQQCLVAVLALVVLTVLVVPYVARWNATGAGALSTSSTVSAGLLLDLMPCSVSNASNDAEGLVEWRNTRADAVLNAYMTSDLYSKCHNWFSYLQDVMVEQTGLRVRVRTNLTVSSTAYPGVTLILASMLELGSILVDVVPRMGLQKFMIFLTDDEYGAVPPERYPPSVVVILRPYYFPSIFADSRHLFFPTGYFLGKGPRRPAILLSATQRHTPCWYSGSITNAGRSAMVDIIQKNASASFAHNFHCVLHVTPGFNSGLSPADFALQMQETVFALAPAGHSSETIRLYEAWENGAIPVLTAADVQLGYLNVTHPGFPAVVLPSWHDITTLVKYFEPTAKARSELDELQHRNIQWYQSFKLKVGSNWRNKILKAFG